MKEQLSYLYLSLRDLVVPLQESLDSLEGIEYLFQKYGWEIELDEELYGKIEQALVLKDPLEQFITAVDSVMETKTAAEIEPAELEVIIEQGIAIIQSLANFEVNNLSGLGEPLDDPAFWEDIAEQVLDDLLVTYIRGYRPAAYALSLFFGVIRFERITSQTTFKTDYTKTIVDWEQLAELVTNPLEAVTNYYHWNQPGQRFNHRELLQNLHNTLEALRVYSIVSVPSDDFLSNPAFNPSPAYNIEEEVMEFYLPLLYGMELIDRAVVELGLSAIPIPDNGSNPPAGLLVRPVARGAAGQEIILNDDFKLKWEIEADASNLMQLKVLPGSIDLNNGEIQAGAGFGFQSTFAQPLYLFGNENTTHVKLQQLSTELKILGNPSDPEMQFIFGIHGDPGLNATLLLDDSDSFLKETVSKHPMEAGFSPEIVWSSKSGITLNGNIALEAVIALNKEIAGIQLETLYVSLGQRKNGDTAKHASLNLGLTVAGNLGPLHFAVDKMGCSLSVIPYTRQQLREQAFDKPSLIFGNLGLDLTYQPPKGIGIQLDSEVITGGGFLELDAANYRYAGVLAFQLALEKRDLGLVAVGLINTRLPNGEPGFSMLLSISVFFIPAIPLAFGFTLNAVGGLVGIDRTMKVDTLRERIQNGAINSIMFPEHVIDNASKILSDLRAVFPPQKQHYVVAPFFKIGYGTPTVMEVDLGLLLEFPFKGRLILLGSLGVYLPDKGADKRLGELHVDIYGDFNFAASYVLIEGRLRDSTLVEVTLTGGFAFLLDWGTHPQFLLSVGGYHPRYKKPARFPDIPRVTALIKKGEDIRLACRYYQAITSNSYQIGASADVVVKKGHARAHGFLGFDALLQFDPFCFEADIRISVDVSYRGRSFCGIEMAFVLSGPAPWRAQGYAKISVLFFSLKIKFNISWGEEQPVVPVIVKPDVLLGQLQGQLQQASNWSAKLPAGYSAAESLRSLEAAEQREQIIMHPAGSLALRQNLIPLNKTIEKVGTSTVETQTSYRIAEYAFGNGDPIDAGTQKPVMDYFSRGQFEDLPDNEKLSTPDFDLMAAGIEFTPDQAYDIAPNIQFTANDFEEIIIGDTGSSKPKNPFNWQGDRVLNLTGRRRTIDVTRPEELFGVLEDMPDPKDPTFKILSKESLDAPERLQNRYFTSYSGAKDFLQINWPKTQQGKWQILQTDTEEEEQVLIR